jgi:hypothetical protein
MMRDVGSNALVSTDKAALDKYRIEKQRVRQIDQLRKDIADLQEKVSNICMIIDRIIEEK